MSEDLRRPLDLPELVAAYHENNATECYRLLEDIPFGAVLDIDRAVFELTPALAYERSLMTHSMARRREYAYIDNGKQVIEVTGQEHAIRLDDFFPTLQELFTSQWTIGVFSHTHPSRKHHPFPSRGDVLHWQMIAKNYPNIQSRIAFRGNDDIKAFRFLFFYG